MMMFASDLDRTLIYSNRALMDFPINGEVELVTVEKKLEKSISFMTRRSLSYLQEISAKLLFVPVTTRSLDQFHRVSFPEASHNYAVTSNGANILFKGRALPEWKEKMTKGLLDSSIHLADLIALIEHSFHIPGEMREVEKLFFYYYLNEKVSLQIVQELTDFVEEKGWRVSLQGHKLYFMPAAVSKGEAIRFIQEREGVNTLIGAGDSIFDDDFLQLCQYPFVLGHGELARLPLKQNYKVIDKAGANGGEELLKSIDELIKKL